MNTEIVSTLDPEWFDHWRKLDARVQARARQTYRRWRDEETYRRRRGKDYVSPKLGPIHRVELFDGYRAVARREKNVYTWFFIGTHAEYEAYFGLNR